MNHFSRRELLIGSATVGATIAIGDSLVSSASAQEGFDFSKPLDGWETVAGRWAAEAVTGAAHGLPIAILTTCLILPAHAIAADHERTRDALNALGRVMSTCSAFFALASSVLKTALPDDETSVASRYDAAGKVMLAQASAIADVTGLESDVVVDWSSSALAQMVKEINADPKNSAAIMTSKYDEPCQRLMRESATRFRQLIDSQKPD
jgi:hypothetical protein